MSKEKRFVIQVDPLEIEDDAIFDNKELRLYECQSDMMSDICSLLNQQDQRIAELEERLKNAIVPKFKIGQKVYKVYTPNQKYPFEFKIIGFKITKSKGEDNIFYNVEEDGFDMGWYPDEILFATEEEAQAKLEELQGESK